EAVRQDVRCAARTLTRSWGFTLLAVSSLGLGLGATSALFSLVDALLLRPLPVAAPDRLVIVRRSLATGKVRPIDGPALEAMRGLTPIYAGVALASAVPSPAVSIDGNPEPNRVVVAATANFLTTVGASAAAGRVAGPDGDEAVAVLSDGFWRA